MLFESLSHVINQESHIYSWNLGKIYLVHFLKFWNLPCFTREIQKFQKSELGKFIPNFPLKHVITSTNWNVNLLCLRADARSEPSQASQVEIFLRKQLTTFSRLNVFKKYSILDLWFLNAPLVQASKDFRHSS